MTIYLSTAFQTVLQRAVADSAYRTDQFVSALLVKHDLHVALARPAGRSGLDGQIIVHRVNPQDAIVTIELGHDADTRYYLLMSGELSAALLAQLVEGRCDQFTLYHPPTDD